MKIAIIGYGKMGKTIERLALAAGHTVPVVLDYPAEEGNPATNQENWISMLQTVDVAIEFTRPEAAPANITLCLEAGVPVVCGTTGWLDHYQDIARLVEARAGTLFYASNFSIGVNLFFALNRWLARLMQDKPDYRAALTEIHHIHKLDAPSGTALTLAQGLLEEIPSLEKWALQPEYTPGVLPIQAIREGEVPGTHLVEYRSAVDSITIRHEAYSREGFAQGAIHAAEWVLGKKGIFNMGDMLGLAI